MFDKAALTYDNDFTNTNIGKLLRNRVWNYLETIIKPGTKLNIFELNCGTGVDAIWLAQQGHNVMATDLSNEMIKITQAKIEKLGLTENVKTMVCDITALDKCGIYNKFDLVFSNFGGLNCLNQNELSLLSTQLFRLLKPNGRFVAVVMPRFCTWESLYFISKFDTQKIFRRNTQNSLQVNVDGENVETWYYSPSDFKQIFQKHFSRLTTKPIGFAIPPSYMENRVGQNKNIMDVLNFSENIFGSITSLSAVSDHFLVDLQKKKAL